MTCFQHANVTSLLAGYGNIRRAKHAKVVEIAGKWGSLSGKGSGKGGSKGGGKEQAATRGRE